MKRIIRLTESDLHRLVEQALNEIDYSNFDFSKTRGLDISDSDVYSPQEIKEKVLAAQTAVKDLLDIMNGDNAGRNFGKEMWDGCYDFYRFITKYAIELKQDCRSIEGSWEEDHSDIPFIRKYDDEFMIDNYYDKQGNPVDRNSFRQNFKPHNR